MMYIKTCDNKLINTEKVNVFELDVSKSANIGTIWAIFDKFTIKVYTATIEDTEDAYHDITEALHNPNISFVDFSPNR